MATEVSQSNQDVIHFARDVIQKAGEVALRYYGQGDPYVKFDEQLVTEAELNLIDFFRSELHRRFPEHQLFGDIPVDTDYRHGQKGNLWVYDALDGMANFQARIPIWGISLALLENFWPILGVFYMPVTRDLFYAQAGQHAYCGDKVIAIPEPGEVSNESLLLTYSRFHNQYSSTFPGKIRNLGCTAAHICYVATGRAEAALLAHVSYQDLAAAGIILEAAGGEIRKMDGGKFHLNEYLDGSRIEDHLLAAPKGKHQSIRDYLRPIG